MAVMEGRIQSGYIANLKVYEGIVNGYVWKLRERLEELDPGCRLLEVKFPGMPREGERIVEEGAKSEVGGLTLLSEVVEGMMILFEAN
jgi:hypothetical protein